MSRGIGQGEGSGPDSAYPRADSTVLRAAGAQYIQPLWAPAARPPFWEPDSLFLLDPVGEAEVLREGGRLASEYSTYFNPDVSKALIVPGPFVRRGIGSPGGPGGPMGIYPVDGLLPADEFTITFWLRHAGGGGHEAAREGVRLLRFGRLLEVMVVDGPRRLRAALGESAAAAEILLGPDVLLPGRWTAFTVVLRDGGLTLAAPGDSQASSGAVAVDAEVSAPSGSDGGLEILDGTEAATAFELAELHVSRYASQRGQMAAYKGPTVTVDAGAVLGDLPPNLGGSLGLYTGFRHTRDGVDPDTGTSIRDQQLRAAAVAGVPLARFGGVVTATGVEDRGEGAEPRYLFDFSAVDDKLRVLTEAGVAIHLTLDYNHPLTGFRAEDLATQVSPPDDYDLYAFICSTILTYLRRHHRIVSVALWNEPQLPEYWSGTRQEYHALWRTVQRRLMADHPDMLLGTADHASVAALVAQLEDVADAGLPVAAMYLHSYHQDVDLLRRDIQQVGQRAAELGLGRLPVRLTEWGLNLISAIDRYAAPTSVVHAWGNRFRSIQAAAYCLAFLHTVAEPGLNVDCATYCSLGSVEPEMLPGAGKAISDETMFSSDDPPRPMPSFNAMSLFWKLGRSRISASSNWPSIRVIGTRDDSVTTVMYGSYRPWRQWDTVDVAFDWSGLPDRFSWRHWQVDAAHSADGRLMLVAAGDQTDLPLGARLGVLGVGCLEITAR